MGNCRSRRGQRMAALSQEPAFGPKEPTHDRRSGVYFRFLRADRPLVRAAWLLADYPDGVEARTPQIALARKINYRLNVILHTALEASPGVTRICFKNQNIYGTLQIAIRRMFPIGLIKWQ